MEKLCAPFYAQKNRRPSIAPGIYVRMLMVGYFEGLRSEREIDWRCADSLSLRAFLGYDLSKRTPLTRFFNCSLERSRRPLQHDRA